MDELFKKIFESEVLTEESKTELKDAFNLALTEAVEEAKAKAVVEVKAELAEQFVNDKEALIEALDTKSEEFMKAHLEELKEDILRFRDLEVEYANKLVEARKEMADVVKSDMGQLIEDLDTFLEFRLNEEFDELREGIEEARKNAFGSKMFNGFVAEYKKNFQDNDETYINLEETKSVLEATTNELKEAQKELKLIKRTQELERVLEPLTGRAREVMEAILKTIPTNKLEETYEQYIGRVLHESANKVEEKSEKENEDSSVLAEKNTTTKVGDMPGVKLVTGDSPNQIDEGHGEEKVQLSESAKRKLQRLAGIEG